MSDLAEWRETRLAAGGYVKAVLARDFLDAKAKELEPEKDRLCLNGLMRVLGQLERADKGTRAVQVDLFGRTVELDYEMAVPAPGEGEGDPATVEHKRYDRMLWGEFAAHVAMVLEQVKRDQARAAVKVDILNAGRDVGAEDGEPLMAVLERLRPH